MNCPRCANPLDQAYYGPCAECRTQLRADAVSAAAARQAGNTEAAPAAEADRALQGQERAIGS